MNKERISIRAGHLPALTFRELWRYRELFWMLAWRNIAVRYRQTFFGVIWALVRPLSTMLAFSFIFGRMAKLSGISGVPYWMLVFSGVVVWQFFSGMVSGGCGGLVGNRGLVTKVYFPRIIIPVSGIMVCVVDLLLALAVFFAMYAFSCRAVVSWRIALLPLTLALLVPYALGLVLMLSALNVRYRDFHHVVPFLLQLGLFVSPVGFSGAVVPGVWRIVCYFNPIYGTIGFARWSLFGAPVESGALISASAISWTVLAIGFAVFRRQEKSFQDYI